MSKKATIDFSKLSVSQVCDYLGALSLKLEQDIDSISSAISKCTKNWESDRTSNFFANSETAVNNVKNEQKIMIDNIRMFLDRVGVQYATAEKMLSSNADRFKK